MAKRLVLLGLGPHHVQLLEALAEPQWAAVQTVLVSTHSRSVQAGQLCAWVAGRVPDGSIMTELAPAMKAANIALLGRRVLEVDVERRRILLDDGAQLGYDVLSLDPEPLQSRDLAEQAMPGARANALFVRPVAGFCALWPRVPALYAGGALRVAVLGQGRIEADTHLGGSDRDALELAFAVRQRLPGAAVTLVTGAAALAEPAPASPPTRLQNLLQAALRQRRITVLPDAACAIGPHEIHLASGARLACDVPILCSGVRLPGWISQSQMALDAAGQVQVDGFQRSKSHPQVFAPSTALGLHGRVPKADTRQLARNLFAALQGGRLAPHPRRLGSVSTISLGDGWGIVHGGRFSLQVPLPGRLAGR